MPLENNNEIDLRKYILIVKKRVKTVIVITLAALIGTLVVNLMAPKLYEASVIFMVANKPAIKADFTGKIETLDMPELSIATYTKLIANPFLAAKVVEDLSKQDSIFSKLTPEGLTGIIQLKDIPNTSLMELKVRYASRDQAIKIANTMADYFIKETDKLSDIQRNQQLFVDKLKLWKGNLENAENNLRQFNATSNLEILNSNVENMTFTVAGYEESVRSLKNGIKENEQLMIQIEGQLKEQQPKLETDKSITNDQFLQQLSKDITKEQAARLNGLKVSSEELNPVYMNILQRRVDLTLRIADDKQKLADYQEGMKVLKKDLQIANAELAAKKMQQARLSQEVDLARDTYKLISQKNDELSIIYSKNAGLVKIVREAYAPASAVSPRVKHNALIGGLVGFLLGVALVLMQEYIGTNNKW